MADQNSHEPMSDERLAEICVYWSGMFHDYNLPDAPPPPDHLHDAIRHVNALLDEVERLRSREESGGCLIDAQASRIAELKAANAAMRPIIEAVATRRGRLSCSWECRVNERWMDAHPQIHERHGPQCFITQARAFLAAHPAQTGEGE